MSNNNLIQSVENSKKRKRETSVDSENINDSSQLVYSISDNSDYDSFKSMLNHYGNVKKCMDHWIIGSTCTLIGGDPGVGKSTLLMHLELGYLRGKWLGYDVPEDLKGGHIIHYMPEGYGQQLEYLEKWGITDEEQQRIKFPYIGTANHRQYSFPLDEEGKKAISSRCEKYNPKIIVVDGLRAAMIGDDNKQTDVKVFFQFFNNLAVKYKACVLITHHYNKYGDGHETSQKRIAGSGAIVANCRAVWTVTKNLTKNSNPDERQITLCKSNAGPSEIVILYTVKNLDTIGIEKIKDTWLEHDELTISDDIKTKKRKNATLTQEDVENLILEYLKDGPKTLTTENMRSLVKDRVATSTLNAYRSSLIDSGKITKHKQGKDFIYDIKETTMSPVVDHSFISTKENECRNIFEKYYKKEFPNVQHPEIVNSKSGQSLHLDGYNQELKIAFEYHGKQHYDYPNIYHKSEKEFKRQQYRDNLKKKRCKELGIHLIIIPYTEDNNLIHFITNQIKEIK